MDGGETHPWCLGKINRAGEGQDLLFSSLLLLSPLRAPLLLSSSSSRPGPAAAPGGGVERGDAGRYQGRRREVGEMHGGGIIVGELTSSPGEEGRSGLFGIENLTAGRGSPWAGGSCSGRCSSTKRRLVTFSVGELKLRLFSFSLVRPPRDPHATTPSTCSSCSSRQRFFLTNSLVYLAVANHVIFLTL